MIWRHYLWVYYSSITRAEGNKIYLTKRSIISDTKCYDPRATSQDVALSIHCCGDYQPTWVVGELLQVVQTNWHMRSRDQHLEETEASAFHGVTDMYVCEQLDWLCVPGSPAGRTCAATPGWPRWPGPVWRQGSEAWSACSACSRPPGGCRRCGLLWSRGCLCLRASAPPPGTKKKKRKVSQFNWVTSVRVLPRSCTSYFVIYADRWAPGEQQTK